MDFGIENRLSKIFNSESGKTVMLAVDHGYFQGPTTGLRNLEKTIKPLASRADCLFITRGMLRNCVDHNLNSSICLRVSGGPSILKELSNEDIIVSMQEAIKLILVLGDIVTAVVTTEVEYTIQCKNGKGDKALRTFIKISEKNREGRLPTISPHQYTILNFIGAEVFFFILLFFKVCM